ncbi:hypothetical protein HYR69_09065 [Candidatus Sumerlaeota bacterium]|nr:hypothetical protein [Candidatus Sumerlaeota bacterium]MBI3737029.1 hypothetical protein [Candidatus Sumerlaeota bacterium]
MSTAMFKVGDTVVEPSIGICRIQGIRQIIVDGGTEDYFIFQGPTAKVLVPRSQLEKRGIRHPMSRDDAKRIAGTLRVPVTLTRGGDAREQYLEYQDTLRSGDPVRISKLLRKLFILDQSNDLKGKEKDLMEQARRFLIEEITFVQELSKTRITDDIDESLRAMYKKKLSKDRPAQREKTAARVR